MVSIVDLENPENPVTSQREQSFLDTFVYDSDGNGTTEYDITFCSTRGNPGYVKWMRNRRAVGERQDPPRTSGSRRP
jgi:hypothetical protein